MAYVALGEIWASTYPYRPCDGALAGNLPLGKVADQRLSKTRFVPIPGLS
jgi:hypothetical protein